MDDPFIVELISSVHGQHIDVIGIAGRPWLQQPASRLGGYVWRVEDLTPEQ